MVEVGCGEMGGGGVLVVFACVSCLALLFLISVFSKIFKFLMFSLGVVG